MNRQEAELHGRAGEAQAAAWLEGQGWSILDQRRRTPRGEIDLIARQNGLVAFFEVKWRAAAAELDFAIDERRLSRVAAAVEAVAHEYACAGEDIRVDVLLLAPGADPHHIVNAWQP